MSEEKKHTTPMIFKLSNYVKPKVEERYSQKWVLNGPKNSFFQYIIDRKNGSPTNSAIINGYVNLTYGRGLTVKQTANRVSNLAYLKSKLKDQDVRRIVSDFKLFGSATAQVIRTKGGDLSSIQHVPRELIAPGKMDTNGEITEYYFSEDWSNTNKYKPEPIQAFNQGNASRQLLEIRPYSAGKTYFADPDYLAALQYAMLEEEISNFSVNHIKNGLSAGFIVNFNNGAPESEDDKEKIERKVKSHTTGSSNAGNVIISWNDSQETRPTVEAFPQNANHEQWQFWSDEARRQIMVGHRVTSPMLFGIKDNTGLGNNAEELDTAYDLLMETVIAADQELIITELERVFNEFGRPIQLEFIPLREDKQEIVRENPTNLSRQDVGDEILNGIADFLIDKGEELDDEYELVIAERIEDVETEKRDIELARTFSSSWASESEQDNELFKIRYGYAPVRTSNDSREFCRKMVSANKVYRKEDIIAAGDKQVNPGFGPNGTDTYSVWLYKGGVNCNHFWERRIYLRRNNKKISVNEARRIILELPPEERKDARLPVNEKEVAQTASPSNNNWRLN